VSVETIRKRGKVRLLVIATDFLGWERGGDWSDVSFPTKHDPHIERIAIVGDTNDGRMRFWPSWARASGRWPSRIS
jgi:hypothetical protein